MNNPEDSKLIMKILNKKISKMNFTVFDLETTGLSPSKHEIIEIGAFKIRKMRIVDPGFHFLVKPKGKIDPHASMVNGLYEKDLEGAPTIDAVLPKFLEFIGDSVLVAHNANFDIRFLQAEAKKLKISGVFYYMDSLSLARSIINIPSYRLENIASVFREENHNFHHANDDAMATAKIFIKFLKLSEADRMEKLHQISSIMVARF